MINVPVIGFVRTCAAYVPTSDAKATLSLFGDMVDTKTNALEWYDSLVITRSADGAWDEAAGLPGPDQRLLPGGGTGQGPRQDAVRAMTPAASRTPGPAAWRRRLAGALAVLLAVPAAAQDAAVPAAAPASAPRWRTWAAPRTRRRATCSWRPRRRSR